MSSGTRTGLQDPGEQRPRVDGEGGCGAGTGQRAQGSQRGAAHCLQGPLPLPRLPDHGTAGAARRRVLRPGLVPLPHTAPALFRGPVAPRPHCTPTPAVALSTQYLPAAPPRNKPGARRSSGRGGALWVSPRHAPDKPTGLPHLAGREGQEPDPVLSTTPFSAGAPGRVGTLNLHPGTFPPSSLCSIVLPQVSGTAASGQPSHSAEQRLQPFLWSFWPACSLQAPGRGQGPSCPVAPSTHRRGPGTCHACSLLKQGPEVGSLEQSPTCQDPTGLLRGHKTRKCPHAEVASCTA